MATPEQLSQIRESLKTELNIELTNALTDQLSSQNVDLNSQILEFLPLLQTQ